MAAELRDDGTMDTVIACDRCGEEERYNWDGEGFGSYDAFVAWALKDFDETHECADEDDPDDDGDPADEPGDDDITTSDDRRFFQYGKLAFEVVETNDGRYRLYAPAAACGTYGSVEAAVRAYCDSHQFWPNVFAISDHGNACLMTY